MSPAIALAVLLGLATATTADTGLAALLLDAEAAYARVDRYTARFVRQEEVGGVLRPPEEALLKFQRPGRIHLRWIAGPPRGRQLLFVKGRDDDRALVHEPGLVSGRFTIVLAPDSPRVLRESRHPITDIGLGPLIERVAANLRRALDEGAATLVDHGVVDGEGPPARRVEMRLPRDEGRGYYAYRAVVTVDVASGIAVGATIFDWRDRMVADYAYRDLRLDAALGPLDFDPANPTYGFPRWRLRL